MGITITDKVRTEIPKILKLHKGGLTFNDLFKELKKIIPELVDNGKDRSGVLRGVINKLESIPIESVIVERRMNNVFYVFVGSKIDELILASKSFVNEINSKDLLSLNQLSLNDDERTIYKEYEDLILKLNKLNSQN
ncbi:MAG: hypothetical protein RR620_12585 [Clostridium sp.]|uniref:hypothetical protein n=1 Tax=Anaerorhabdus sp. TaxID=1872524 RepID=UPI002FCB1E0C